MTFFVYIEQGYATEATNKIDAMEEAREYFCRLIQENYEPEFMESIFLVEEE